MNRLLRSRDFATLFAKLRSISRATEGLARYLQNRFKHLRDGKPVAKTRFGREAMRNLLKMIVVQLAMTMWPLPLTYAATASAVNTPENDVVQQARAHFEAGNYEAAIATLKAISERTADREGIYFWLGRSYYEKENYSEA